MLRQMWQAPRTWAAATAAPSRAFKVVSALQRRCNSCRIVRRGKKVYVLCVDNPRHKQRQGKRRAVYRRT